MQLKVVPINPPTQPVAARVTPGPAAALILLVQHADKLYCFHGDCTRPSRGESEDTRWRMVRVT